MNLWESIYSAEGETGVARADKELDVFVWSVRGKQLWKFLVRSPDVIIDKERKIEVLQDHLESIGCSPLFINLMGTLFLAFVFVQELGVFDAETIFDSFLALRWTTSCSIASLG